MEISRFRATEVLQRLVDFDENTIDRVLDFVEPYETSFDDIEDLLLLGTWVYDTYSDFEEEEGEPPEIDEYEEFWYSNGYQVVIRDIDGRYIMLDTGSCPIR